MTDRDKLIEAIMPRTGFAGDVMAREGAEGILAAHDAWLEANGLVVVPKEPTEAMLEAGDEVIGMPWGSVIPPSSNPAHYIMGMVWSQMLAAAPLPANQEGGG